jgi:hypothetical protein
MANFDRASRDRDDDRDGRDYDGGSDDDDNESSHLPVVIIIAILVLAAFGGVVWLAYNQGVARGRNDGPVRIAATTKTDDSGLKVYQQSAGPDEEGAKAPAPAPAAQPPAVAQTQATPAPQPAQTPEPQAAAPATPPPPPPFAGPKTAMQPPPAPQVAPKAFTPFATPKPQPQQQVAAAKPQPQQQVAAAKPYTQPATDDKPQVATKPPAQLGGAHPATVAPAPAPTKTAAAPAPLKPAAMKPVDTPAKPAASGSYLLQVGAFKSDAEARTAWKAYQSKHAALLNGFGPDVQKVDLGDKGTWYRLRIASFADKDAAVAVCDRLKAQGGSCFLAK